MFSQYIGEIDARVAKKKIKGHWLMGTESFI